MEQLLFAWKVAKSVKSNAILLAKDFVSVGVGAGQMNRVNSARIAVMGAGDKAKGAVCASDAFMPFPDSLEVCAEAGVTAVIQPGGSMRDDRVSSPPPTTPASRSSSPAQPPLPPLGEHMSTQFDWEGFRALAGRLESLLAGEATLVRGRHLHRSVPACAGLPLRCRCIDARGGRHLRGRGW